MPNRFQPIQVGTDQSQQLAIINNNFAQLDNENVSKIFYDVNGVPSISIGVGQDKTSRIRVARVGIDVTKATDDQLAFNSAQNTVLINNTATISLPGKASVAGFTSVYDRLTIPHGLSEAPAFFLYVRLPKPVATALSHFPAFYFASINNGGGFNDATNPNILNIFWVGTDDTNIYITHEVNNGDAAAHASSDILIKYLILQESAN